MEIADIESADVALLPGDWGEYGLKGRLPVKRAKAFISRCRARGLRTLVFFFNDSDRPVDEEGTIVFRTSLRRSRQRPNEFAMPAWCHDVQARYSSLGPWIRVPEGRPVVGFCGFAPGGLIDGQPWPRRAWQALRRSIRDMAVSAGARPPDGSIRSRAMEVLVADARVKTNFILRKTFLGHVVHSADESDSRLEFVRNMASSDYILCARGAGNYSWRLYEALSCGRIPLLVDTDCALPLPGKFDWNRLCVKVDYRDVGRIANIVHEDYSRMSPRSLQERQRECHAQWRAHLSMHGFLGSLCDWIREHVRHGSVAPFRAQS
jgi:hypothetical protein